MTRKSKNDSSLVEVVTLFATRKFSDLIEKERRRAWRRKDGKQKEEIIKVLNRISEHIPEIKVDPNSFEKMFGDTNEVSINHKGRMATAEEATVPENADELIRRAVDYVEPKRHNANFKTT